MKIVTKATVEVVPPEELNIGDKVLYRNIKCTIVNINVNGQMVTMKEPNGCLVFTQIFSTYYRVIACVEMCVCPHCGKEWRE